MKTWMFAIIAGAAALPVMPAMAQNDGQILGAPQFSANGYANRGACESALAHERNSQRKNPATRGSGYNDLSGSDFNKASRETTTCELRGDRYQVIYRAPQQ